MRTRAAGFVAAALRPGGVLVFTILYLAFFSWAIVDEGPGGQRYRKVTGYLEHETRWRHVKHRSPGLCDAGMQDAGAFHGP